MPGVVLWETGYDFNAITATGLTVGADGSFTNGSSYDLIGTIDEMDHTGDSDEEDIRPLWSLIQNTVRTGIGHSMRITCLRGSTGAQRLTLLYGHYLFCTVAWTQGVENYVGYFRIHRFNNNPRGHGAQRVSLELRPIDPGTGFPNVSFA